MSIVFALCAVVVVAASDGGDASCQPYNPGQPVSALAKPGQCVFGEEWASSPLLSRSRVSHDTHVLTFGLDDADKPLGLSTCACLLARASVDSEPVIRPYTPVSTNAMIGQFQIMVKEYSNGSLSRHLGALEVGDSVEFKHIPFNVKIQYPFEARRIGMIAGGTGVTPMLQALHALLGTPGDTTRVAMLYSSRTEDDILAREALEAWRAAFPERLSVTHTLTREAAGSDWDGSHGRIDRALIEAHIPPPGDDTLIFVCGPPSLYDSLAGPRGGEFAGTLAAMGFSESQVVKF